MQRQLVIPKATKVNKLYLLRMAECRHPDIQRFGEIRCCLSCGEAIFETAPDPEALFNSSDSSLYSYGPLRYTLGQEIRLIVLYAGMPPDDLCCDIIVVNLEDRPAYEAVSYTWADADGNASLTSNIFCQGKYIPITNNCEAALRRLRLQSRSRRLWIDAICINQSDISEKNHQVKLMSKIYMKASQVLAYLGVEPHQVTSGMRHIIDYLQYEDYEMPHGPDVQEQLTGLFELAYFDRIWILQEVGLSQLVTLIIGTDQVRWTGAAISKTLTLSHALGIQPPSILWWNPASRPEEERDILAVLSRGRSCSATDARDKVYALLGLVHSDFSRQLGIDYSLSPAEVFTKLAVYCITLGRFDVLLYVHHTETASRPSPTWVPRWDLKDVFEPPPMRFSQEDQIYFASSWHVSHAQPDAWVCHELPQRIRIEQILIWSSNEPGPHANCVNPSTATWRHRIHGWVAQRLIHDANQDLSSEDIDFIARKISMQKNQNFTYQISERDAWSVDDVPSELSLPSRLPYLKLRAHLLGFVTESSVRVSSSTRPIHLPFSRRAALGSTWCQSCIDAKVSFFKEDAMQQAREHLHRKIEQYGRGKRVFPTEYSYGITRVTTQIGDSVWVLCGADVPFILRQQPHEHYHLIGDCYLYGAGKPFPCKHCGADVAPWPMQTEIIDIW